MEAIILAGGKGTRLRGLVNDRPKPLAEVNGVPFIYYILDHLYAEGFSRFIISVGFEKDMIINTLGYSYRQTPISYVREDTPLGTGGAFVECLSATSANKPILLINGDTYFLIKTAQLIQTMRNAKADAALALFKATESNRYGKVNLSGKEIGLDQRYSKAKKGEIAFGGIALFQSNEIKKYCNIRDVPFSFDDEFLPNIIANEAKVVGQQFSSPFIDIGVPVDYLKLCDQVKHDKKPRI